MGISSEPASESYLIPNLVFLQEVGFASGSVGSGVIVQGIEPNSLAETLGLQAGDIILKVNDKEVSIENLSTLLAQV
ncbi:MAG: PDZ domain-containing protein [Candidatus Peribacteria bacterium]|nr:PDZ domain-containing protein [Candidatus Peribacteria bacterium]